MDDQKKDGWDIFSLWVPILSALIIVIGGNYIALHFQQRQLNKDNNYKEMDLLVKLMPSLSSKDTTQNKVAIFVLNSLGYDYLANDIAKKVNSVGTRSAIKQISSDSTMSLDKRKIYIDNWNQLKKIPPSSIRMDSLKKDSSKILFGENGSAILGEDGHTLFGE